MVLAHADILAGIELGAALAHDHVAARNGFAAEQLHAQHLGVGIATVARRTASFLVCHTTGPLTGSDAQHLHGREVLAMTALAVGVLAALLLESDDFLALAVL